MIGSKTRVQPTDYPRIPFHGLRSAQLVSSAIVSGIMSYFVWQLRHDGFDVPWTFILLLAVSTFTIVHLIVTIVAHFLTGLHPHMNMFSNAFLSVLWATGFALFTWWSSETLTNSCSKNNWHSSAGMHVCRLFKTLFAFTCVGLVSTFLATYLDLRVYRDMTRLGKYGQMQTKDLDQTQTAYGEDEVIAPRRAYQRYD